MGRELWVVGCLTIAGAGISVQAGKGVEGVRSYDTGFAKVELVGVCRASEFEVECWNPEGKPDAELQDEFKGAFSRNDYVSVPIKYGRKTRVALFRFTNPPYNDPRGTIDSYFQGSSSSFDWPNRNSSSSADSERVELRAAVLFAKPNEATGSVQTSIRRTAPASKRLPLKVGASVEYLGSTFTVRRIVKSNLDPNTFAADGVPRWTIAMTAEEKEGLPPTVSWVPIDHDGLVIRAVDKNGNPVPIDPNTSPFNGYNPVTGRPSVPKVFPAQFSGSSFRRAETGDDFPVLTNINPSKIKEFYGLGSSTEKLTITGIPLDPAK